MNLKKIEVKKLSLFSVILLSFLRFSIRMFFRIFYFTRVEGLENIPKEGGVILVPNHVSFYDPPLVGSYSTRMCRYLARETLFTVPIFGRIIYICGALPIKRESADKAAITQSIKLLKTGETIIVFPEGTRTKDGKLGELKSGAISLAMHTHAAIVPVTIHNGYKAFSRYRKFPRFFVPMRLKFYKPFKFDKDYTKEEAKKLQAEVLSSLEEILKTASE